MTHQTPESTVKFRLKLIESVDDTISSLCGANVVEPFHTYLKSRFELDQNNLPECLSILASAIESAFGETPSRTICKAIARKLYNKFGCEFVEMKGYGIGEYVELAKMRLGLVSFG
jgi:hypothetical protein